jgi:hypothetical protein
VKTVLSSCTSGVGPGKSFVKTLMLHQLKLNACLKQLKKSSTLLKDRSESDNFMRAEVRLRIESSISADDF